MIQLSSVSKTFGAQTLFTDATIQFDPGKRYGLVGANGSGKSTLLRIVAGEEEVSDGNVSIPKRLRLGVLRQDHFELDDVPIIDVVMMGDPELWNAIKEKEIIVANSHIEFDADRYAELEDIVMARDGYAMEARAAEILEGLNIPERKHRDPMSTLSGGYKLRVLMAQTLASSPDVLLLDEPTNHLDIVSIRWLEKFLIGFSGVVVVVSHDRRFLDAICTHIVDVDYERITVYTGDYTAFEEAKVENRQRLETEIAKREKEIADHKAFIDRFKAKATKARQANSKAKRMEKIVIEKLPESSRQYPKFRFNTVRPSGKDVLTAVGISKAYGEQQVLEDVDLQVTRGDRLAIIGPNGIGKSTLLKIFMGHVEADAGEVEWGYETHVGYFSQDHGELEGEDNDTVLSWLWKVAPEQNAGFVRGKLAEVLFGRDDVDKLIGALSGGESARLLFSRLGILAPNVLVLDEPTNHLDIEGIESLADGLDRYEGTLVFVSHDRWFVSELANRIVEIRHDGIEDYRGTYAEYLRHCGDDHLDIEAAVERAKRRRN